MSRRTKDWQVTKMADKSSVLTPEQLSAREEKENEVAELNKSRTGKGTRLKVGSTRGKNPQVITFEAFDLSKPETLPTTTTEFLDLTKISDDATLVSYLIGGYNEAMQDAASDPIGEYVDSAWPEDIQKGFRTAVRAYSQNAKQSIEDSVALIRPGFVAAFNASKAQA